MKQTFYDAQFGTVQVRRIATAKFVRIRVATDGALVVTAPHRARMTEISALINSARDKLHTLVAEHSTKHPAWENGSRIGERHVLAIIPDERISAIKCFAKDGTITIRYPRGTQPEVIQQKAYDTIKKTLRAEAKKYMPERLAKLASAHGFHYERLRYSTANGRWGSCSSSGTISLNIWLMTLPDAAIDYVMIHELAHTKHMNHSQQFWDQVATCMPDYKARKKVLSQHSPRN